MNLCACESEGVPRNVHTHTCSCPCPSRPVLRGHRFLLLGILALPYTLPLPVSPAGAIACVGGRDLCVLCRRSNIFFLTTGKITLGVIICNVDLSLLSLLEFFLLCLLRGFSIMPCNKTFGCFCFLAEWTLVEQNWGSKQSFVLLSWV